MKLRKLLRTPGLVLIASLLAACTAAKPIGEWRDESYTGQVEHILIIGVTARNERRRAFETQFVEALAARGVSATPSYRLITSSVNLTRESVEQAIQGANISGVLVTRLAGVKQAEMIRQPSAYDGDDDYFTHYNLKSRETTQAYYDEHRVLTLETNLYDAVSGNLVWRMESEAIDAARPRDVIAAQVELTVKTLSKRGLIAASR
jgi:hypothetical protein